MQLLPCLKLFQVLPLDLYQFHLHFSAPANAPVSGGVDTVDLDASAAGIEAGYLGHQGSLKIKVKF